MRASALRMSSSRRTIFWLLAVLALSPTVLPLLLFTVRRTFLASPDRVKGSRPTVSGRADDAEQTRPAGLRRWPPQRGAMGSAEDSAVDGGEDSAESSATGAASRARLSDQRTSRG